jgi:hypothetical protein
MAGHRDSCGIEVIEGKGTLMDESVKWAGKNVLPSCPQAVLLVEMRSGDWDGGFLKTKKK